MDIQYRNDLSPRVKQIVKRWNARARVERDSFSRFVFYYFCFNAVITNLSGEESDRRALNWVYVNPNILSDTFDALLNNAFFIQQITGLQMIGPIPTNRQPPRPAEIAIQDPRSIRQVFDFIYQIRCNLFHGRKTPNDVLDQKLVSASSKAFQKLIGNLAIGRCGPQLPQ